MTEPTTSKILFAALKEKFPKAAVLREVTMEDEVEAELCRTAWVILKPQMRKRFDKLGQSYDAVLPDGYLISSSIPVRRIDALMFEGKRTTAVEIKISRADFFRDTLAKRAPWMRHTDRFVYLTPAGLVKPEEVPEGCGLWEYSEGRIVSVKNAKVNKEIMPFPPSMFKYFAWRAFSAESKLDKRR